MKMWFKTRVDALKARIARSRQERRKYAAEFQLSLNNEVRGILRWVSFIAIFAWLDFAFNTDPQLHPEFGELLYFRLGLTALGLIVFLASFIPPLFKNPRLWIWVLAIYAVGSTSFFTGRIADDANYVSGLQIIIFIIAIAPISYRDLCIMLVMSIVLFITSALIYQPDLSTAGSKYSMNNLVLVYILCSVLGLFLNQFRFNLYVRHREVEILKEKQDGDYYLTSALVKPLSDLKYEAENVEITSLVEQYKKFKFRRWNSEIGGDYCSAHEVELKGKKYAVFVNADAMGKSIQGAGGALVLGTVFKSVIARNQNTQADKDQFPERWLKKLFVELQDVFVSFEGSMLISAVIGLLDLRTGMVYYINSEHPWVALYRDGKASFIEDELELRKIGIEGQDNLLTIKTFSMQPGDVLFLGSDGRDDVVLDVSADGKRNINEDETLFLKTVELGHGDLGLIKQEILQLGDLSDDLSLMRIEFKHNTQRQAETAESTEKLQERVANISSKSDLLDLVPIFNTLGNNPGLARRLYSLYVSNKYYEQAFDLCAAYVDNNPADTEFLYYAGYVAKLYFRQSRKRETLAEAADYAERCRLRDRTNIKNLVNLANVHQILGNLGRSKKIIGEIERLDPDNDKIDVLKQALDLSS